MSQSFINETEGLPLPMLQIIPDVATSFAAGDKIQINAILVREKENFECGIYADWVRKNVDLTGKFVGWRSITNVVRPPTNKPIITGIIKAALVSIDGLKTNRYAPQFGFSKLEDQ